MTERRKWALLSYRLPREPSTPRISVWRKLRQIGAAQIVDGLVALPAEDRTREHLGWLAQEIREAGGEAWVWEAALAGLAQERLLVANMAQAVGDEYRQLAASARKLGSGRAAVPVRSLRRLRRELHAVIARDYFGSAERRAAADAIERLARNVELAT